MIAIVDYGMGNLRSVQKACEAVGGVAVITDLPADVQKADKVILPGVGAFCDAIKALTESGLKDAVLNFVRSGRPLLGVCLGYQMLFDRSYEDGVYEGLGLIHGEIREIEARGGLKVPHMGWNDLRWERVSPLTDGMKDGDAMYFVHSFAAYGCERGDILATTQYGGEIIAAVSRENIAGFQFHPEKSGKTGLRLLENFVR